MGFKFKSPRHLGGTITGQPFCNDFGVSGFSMIMLVGKAFVVEN
jgi:hypothetical protein